MKNLTTTGGGVELSRSIRLIVSSLLLLLAFTTYSQGWQQWIEFTRTDPEPPIIQLISSDNLNVEFTVEVCGMYQTDTVVNNTSFQRIIIPGGGRFLISGEPEMPYIRQLIALPECDSVVLSVDVTSSSTMQNYYIYPAPDYIEVTNPDSTVYLEEVFCFDTVAYNTNQYYPQVNAEIHSIGYFRDQKYAEVFIYPVQFNPVSEEIHVNEEYEITLSFVNPSTPVNANVGIFNNIATNTMLNYPSSGISAVVNDNVEQNGIIQWVTLTNTGQASNIVADYLIICSNPYWKPTDPNSEILKIATHRSTYNGFDIAILNVENILALGFEFEDPDYESEQKIRSCIKLVYEGENAQHTLDGKLGYVLLIGDVDLENEGMPTSFEPIVSPGDLPSDYYFSCVTEENGEYDPEGDLFIGRFCVDNNELTGVIELQNIVEKTILFEHEYGFEDWRNNIGFVNDNILVGEYFLYFYEFINNLIEEEEVSIVDGIELNGLIHQPTIDILNQGSFYVQYDGHGQIHAWPDWLDINHFEAELTNTVKFPFVTSYACQTGHFDHYSDCLGEALTTYSEDKGFVGFLGASRDIWATHLYPPIQIISLQEKIPYSIWNNSSYITGEFILEAKITSTLQEKYAFNYFGDPGMNLMAQGFEITRNVTTPVTASVTKEVFLRSGYTVTVPANATLTLENDGKLIVEEGATLNIMDNASLSALSGIDSLIVYGDLNIGNNVSFTADAGASFVIDIRNSDLTLVIVSANFNNIKLTGVANALIIGSSDFNNSFVEYYRDADNQYFLTQSTFSNTTVKGCRGEAITNEGNFVITGCTFNNQSGESVIYIDSFRDFQISDDTINYSTGDGISLFYSGSAVGRDQDIMDCNIQYTGDPSSSDGHHGIKVYCSHANIENNYIYNNNTGLACLQRSSINLTGDSQSESEDETQRIKNNFNYQVYSDGSSFPYDFEYNAIYDDDYETYFVYMDNNIFTGYVIQNNYWGTDFTPANNLYPSNAYNYIPVWEPSWGGLKSGDPAQDLFYSAKQNVIDSNYVTARSDFQEIIENYPGSRYLKASVKELMGLTDIYDQDYPGLQEYLESTENLWEDEETIQITEYFINWCDMRMENYSAAISWFEDRILNPVNYEDSICSIIDLGYVYTLMGTGNRYGAYTGNLPQYKPVSREAYERNREWLIDLLPQIEQSAQDIEKANFNNKEYFIQVYPNPVESQATIEYFLAEDAGIIVKLHNSKGELIRILINSVKERGTHNFTWETKEFANGLYFVSLEINGNLVKTQSMILAKH